MDAHSLKVLEYGEIISMLRERTACSLGDFFASSLAPSTDRLAISNGQRETSEAKGIIEEEGSLPLGGLHDIRSFVDSAGMGGILEAPELLTVAETLSSGRRLRAFITKRAERCPGLTEIAGNIGEFIKLENAVFECVSDSGEIKDTASPELARIRSKLKINHSRIVERLRSLISSADYKTMIQDHVVTQRGDRYCIPVKAEHKFHFPGIVHDSSASGATLFIEPASVVDMGNEINELSVKEIEEMRKILKRLSGMIGSSKEDIRITLDSAGRLDFASAKGRLSCDMDACEPIFNDKYYINLYKARHPLLMGEVVPIDVELGRKFTALLITGPNTGGKTVTLKTIGLLVLMAQSGLHIPAESGSETSIIGNVFADIGDEQSIQQSLSTFSSHLINIVDLIKSVDDNTLALLDEIGAGTDPAEGAALAKAIVDFLMKKGAIVVATTHYGELKEFAFLREGIENASVEFDVKTLQPTYRLMMGVPGSSNAFAIAARLGLDEEIIDAAAGMMGTGEKSEDIIRRIEESYRAAAEREQLAERTSRDVEKLRERYETGLSEVKAIRRDVRKKAADEIDARVREKIEDLDRVLSELKAAGGDQKAVQKAREEFKKTVAEVYEEVEDIAPVEELVLEEPVGLKAGDRVMVNTFGAEGELLQLGDGDQATVLIGHMRAEVPVNTLKKIAGRVKKGGESGVREIANAKAASVSSEIMLRAQRVEEALINLDKYIDDAYVAGLDSVRVVHGKGTGALKKAVRDYLASHKFVKSYYYAAPNLGGDGVTVVEFKK